MNNIAFLFPGQGSQYIGMGGGLIKAYPIAKKTFEEANEALGFDLLKLCLEGDIEVLTKTENTQPAILTASVAAYRVYMEEVGRLPEYMAGHSLGEFSALCCSGAIAFSDAVRIVRQRGKFMQEAVPVGLGSMAAISKAEQTAIEEVVKAVSKEGHLVVVSNYNSPAQIVISGHTAAVAEAGDKLQALGARVTPLKVSAPFHSPLMQPAADQLNAELKKYTFHDLQVPVVSNVTALVYPSKDHIIESLSLQIVQPVRWVESMVYLKDHGVGLAIEMGPQTVLKNLTKKNLPDVKVFAYDEEADKAMVKKMLSAGSSVMVLQGVELIKKCVGIAVTTKNENWDNDAYQKGVVEPYKQLCALRDELVKEEMVANMGQVTDALDLLKTILATKNLPIDEQQALFQLIFKETGSLELLKDYAMPA